MASKSKDDYVDGFRNGYIAGYKKFTGSSAACGVPGMPGRRGKRPSDPHSNYDWGFVVGYEMARDRFIRD